jgi:hypothetical protein
MEPYPFSEEKLSKNVVVRTFDANLESEELLWHWDDEDRLVEVIGETDWKFQFDNQLPIEMNKKIFIPKGIWHRTIKGHGDLVVKITKY